MLRRARVAPIAALGLALPLACGKQEPAPGASPAPQVAAPPANRPADPKPDPAPLAPPADSKADTPLATPPADHATPPVTMAVDVAALARSDKKLAIKTTVDNDPGFRLDPLLAMHALALTPGQPGFAAPLRDPARAQDDDFLTAATCTFGQPDKPCALGLALPQGAEVTMLRLFLAAGPDYRDYTGAPRPKRLAIHTDLGRVELDYPDGATDRYIIFAQPIATAGISLEILDVYPGRKHAELHFAEVEVYGTKGDGRPPLQLPLAETFVYYETQPWKDKGSGHHTVMMTWLERLGHESPDRPGPRRRWIRGMAAYGNDDDRFILVQRALSSTCDAPELGHLLIDRETRMIYPLGPLAGGNARIYRHHEGLGFLAAPPGDGEAAVAGIRTIVLDPEKQRFDRRRGKKTWTLADHLHEWNFATHGRRPGGRDLDRHVADPESNCEVLTGDDLTAALAASEVFSEDLPGEWYSCGIGDGHKALLGRDRPCGEAVSILLKTPDGEIRRRAEFAPGAGPRRIAIEAEPSFPGLLIEVGKDNGAASDLVPVNTDFYDAPILRNASLTVRPPAACGPCLLTYGADEAAPEAVRENAQSPEDASEDAPSPESADDEEP